MSIVVGVIGHGRTVMAADTQSSLGAEVLPPDNQASMKIRRVGDSLLGRAGWGVYDNILEDHLAQEDVPDLGDAAKIFSFFTHLWKVMHKRYSFVNDQAKRKDSPFGDMGGSFLVGNLNGIFYVAPNLGVTRFNHYYAIGSGADYSLGALYQLHGREQDVSQVAQRAVETAIAFNANCGGKIELQETG